MPITSVPLAPEEEKWRSAQHGKAHSSKYIEHRRRTCCRFPVDDEAAGAIRYKILEDHACDKDSRGHVTIRVDGVCRGRDGRTADAEEVHAMKNGGCIVVEVPFRHVPEDYESHACEETMIMTVTCIYRHLQVQVAKQGR